MRLITLPGVYRPRSDTRLLIEAVLDASLPPASRVLELCTGSGAVALHLTRRGHEVVAVDLGRRAVLTARINARLNGLRMDVRRGDLFEAVGDQTFDVIVANPPYLPAPPDTSPSGAARAWDAGPDGRLLLDRICDGLDRHLTPDGRALILQSTLSGIDETKQALEDHGMTATIVKRHRGPLGAIASERAAYLASRGHTPGDDEELIVFDIARSAVPTPVG